MNTPTLYQPSVTELVKVSESAKRRHPALGSRIDKARDLLLCGGLQLDTAAWDVRQVARWCVASQSGKGAYVIVNGACPCEDNRHNGVSHCKHSIATHLIAKILANHVNADIRSGAVELDALPNGNFALYAYRMGIVQVRWDGSAFLFTDNASMVRYSIWLATQQSIAVEWPVAQPAMIAA